MMVVSLQKTSVSYYPISSVWCHFTVAYLYRVESHSMDAVESLQGVPTSLHLAHYRILHYY